MIIIRLEPGGLGELQARGAPGAQRARGNLAKVYIYIYIYICD